MSRCKHGIEGEWCVECLNPSIKPIERYKFPQKARPKVRGTHVQKHKKKEENEDVQTFEYVIVNNKKGDPSLSQINYNTILVHIQGYPFVWLIRTILEKGNNIKKIQVIPTMMKKLGKSHKLLCEEKGVEITSGRWCPELAWDKGEVRRNRAYHLQKKFLQTLEGKQKECFEELNKLGFMIYEMVTDYFSLCNLHDQKNHTYLTIAEKYGLCHESHACLKIQGLIYYLDGCANTSKLSKIFAYSIQERVERLRMIYYSKIEKQKILENLGLPDFPKNMPLSRLEILEAIIQANRDGSLTKLQQEYPKRYKILMLRFGLDDINESQYRTLEDIGNSMLLTRERIRQLEIKALDYLKIKDFEVSDSD